MVWCADCTVENALSRSRTPRALILVNEISQLSARIDFDKMEVVMGVWYCRCLLESALALPWEAPGLDQLGLRQVYKVSKTRHVFDEKVLMAHINRSPP
jgi:hypothetical protein